MPLDGYVETDPEERSGARAVTVRGRKGGLCIVVCLEETDTTGDVSAEDVTECSVWWGIEEDLYWSGLSSGQIGGSDSER